MATEMQIIITLISIVIVETLIIWLVHCINELDALALLEENKRTEKRSNRIQIWFIHNIVSRRQMIIVYEISYASVVLSFWGMLYIWLQEESFEIIIFTWFMLPFLLILGLLDSYSGGLGKKSNPELTEERLRLAIKYFFEQSKLGNEEAREKLEELRNRNDAIGLLTKQILQEIDEGIVNGC